MAFYSDRLYADVGKRWKGFGFQYLIILMAICWAIVVLNWLQTLVRLDFSPEAFNYERIASQEKEAIGTKDEVYQIVAKVITQVPEITIKQGKASVGVPMPYTIFFPETSIPLAVIDTSGKTKSLEDTSALVLLTKEKLFIRKDQVTAEIHALAEFEDMVVDGDTLREWAQAGRNSLLWILPLVFFPIETLISLVWIVLLTTVYGMMAMVIARMLKIEQLQFLDFFRITAVASTPAVLYSTIKNFAPFFGAITFKNDIVAIQPIPSYNIWGIVVTVMYLLFAVVSNIRTKGNE